MDLAASETPCTLEGVFAVACATDNDGLNSTAALRKGGLKSTASCTSIVQSLGGSSIELTRSMDTAAIGRRRLSRLRCTAAFGVCWLGAGTKLCRHKLLFAHPLKEGGVLLRTYVRSSVISCIVLSGAAAIRDHVLKPGTHICLVHQGQGVKGLLQGTKSPVGS